MRRKSTFPTQQAAEPTSDSTQALVPLPNGFSPEGVAEAFIDPIVKYLIEQTIPGGWEVFVHLLYYATLDPRTTMQHSLFHATGESNNEAIVLVKNVKSLAKSLNSPLRAPDAYARKLIAFETLKVIQRKVHRTFTEIRIPLGKRSIHVPSLLTAMWDMHEIYKEEKVKQLARKMAKRVKTGEFLTYAASTCVRVEPELVPVHHVLDSLFQARGITEEASVLASACGIIAKLLLPEKYGRVGDIMGEFHALLPKASRSTSVQTGELDSQLGELQNDTPAGREETGQTSSVQTGELDTAESPKCTGSKAKHRSYRVKKDELQRLFATNSPIFGQFGRETEEMGDSVPRVSLSDHYFSNTITNKETESLNGSSTSDKAKQGELVPSQYKDTRPIEEIRRDAIIYCDLFDGQGNRRWIGSMIKCVQQYPSNIRHIAVIDTLFHTAFPDDYRGKPRVPGAWFSKAASQLVAPDVKIAREIQLWAESGLAYNEIEKAMQQGLRTPLERLLPMGSGNNEGELVEAEQEHEGMQEPPLPTSSHELGSERPSLACRSLRTRMNRSQAEDLQQRILHEGAYYGIIATLKRGEQGSSVVVTTWAGVEEMHVNEGEWEKYFAEVKTCL